MATATSLVTSRACACNCGGRFIPLPGRPGQQYLYGHKPKAAAKPLRVHLAEKTGETSERRLIDYRLAVSTLLRERKELERIIEQADEEIEQWRKAIETAQGRKDHAVERHLMLETAARVLDGVITGQTLAGVIGEGN